VIFIENFGKLRTDFAVPVNFEHYLQLMRCCNCWHKIPNRPVEKYKRKIIVSQWADKSNHHPHHCFNVCFPVLAQVRRFPLIPILQWTRSCTSSPPNLKMCIIHSYIHLWYQVAKTGIHEGGGGRGTFDVGEPIRMISKIPFFCPICTKYQFLHQFSN